MSLRPSLFAFEMMLMFDLSSGKQFELETAKVIAMKSEYHFGTKSGFASAYLSALVTGSHLELGMMTDFESAIAFAIGSLSSSMFESQYAKSIVKEFGILTDSAFA